MKPWLFMLITAGVAASLACTAPVHKTNWNFEEIVVDPSPLQPSRITDVSTPDIDGDGRPDLWFSGRGFTSPEHLTAWYRNTGDPHKWERCTPFDGPSIGAAWGDVDGDGDPDLVTGRERGHYPMVWMENPRPAGDPATDSWPVHLIHPDPEDPDEVHADYMGTDGRLYLHLDFNGDGRLDILVSAFKTTLWYLPGPEDPKAGPWEFIKIAEENTKHGGAAVGDLDGDGDLDAAWGNGWFENPGDPARAPWLRHDLAPDFTPEAQVIMADMDADGRLDVVLSGEESDRGVAWYHNPGGQGPWIRHTVLEGWEGLHSLQAADFDGDGDLDILTAEMHTRGEHRVAILENTGAAGTWIPHLLSHTGSHKAVAWDLDGDGDMDIVGKNFDGDKAPRIWLNPNGSFR